MLTYIHAYTHIFLRCYLAQGRINKAHLHIYTFTHIPEYVYTCIYIYIRIHTHPPSMLSSTRGAYTKLKRSLRKCMHITCVFVRGGGEGGIVSDISIHTLLCIYISKRPQSNYI